MLPGLQHRSVEREDEPQAFLVIRDTRSNINGSWLLRPTARRTIINYLVKFPREESESRIRQDVVSLQLIRDDLADEEEHMEESILTANSGMRRGEMGFRITEPGEEEGQGTNEQRDQPMEELPTPSEETHDPERESRIKPRKAMLFDGPEQPSGSETAEERRSRLVRESLMTAHARMQVLKTHYNLNKTTYPEMRRELGDDVDGKGLFKF